MLPKLNFTRVFMINSLMGYLLVGSTLLTTSQFSLAELKDISKYLSKLPTEMAVVPQSRFR